MHHHVSEDKETAIAEHVEVVPPQPYPVEIGEKGHNDGWVAERNSDDKDVVTLKTWIVCIVLASAYGVSFWIVPSISAIGVAVATDLGDSTASSWYVALWTMTCTIAFMICGANSDLFGRRWFIISGDVLMCVGYILGGTAKNNTQMFAAMGILGFGAGNAQLSAFALPELLPNRWRVVGVVITGIGDFAAIVGGPIAARYAIIHGDQWRWLFYGPAIFSLIPTVALALLYFPPQHPRGLPFRQALRELDYIGGFLFIAAAALILSGIVYTVTESSSSPRVIGLLVPGFVVMLGFAAYETFGSPKQPLCPTHLFTRDYGRELTFPFICGFVVTMFYYCANIVWGTQVAVFFTTPTTTLHETLLMTLPGNLGICAGFLGVMVFGNTIGRYKWQLTTSITVMVVFGALLALGTPERKTLLMAMVGICQIGFGWSQMLTITWIQFGAPQVELGVSGGLAGVSRFAGGAVAVSVYSTILANVQSSHAAKLIPAAAMGAGLPASTVPALLAALPLGADALATVPGISMDIITAASAALVQSYQIGLRTTALSSLAFGGLAIISSFLCNDITPKMNDKIEVFLENTEQARKNEFH